MSFLPSIDTNPRRGAQTPRSSRQQRPKTSIASTDRHSAQRAKTAYGTRIPALTTRTPRPYREDLRTSGRSRPGTSSEFQKRRFTNNLVGDSSEQTDSESESEENHWREKSGTPRDEQEDEVTGRREGITVTRIHRAGLPQNAYNFLRNAKLKKPKPGAASDLKFPEIAREERKALEEKVEQQEQYAKYRGIIDNLGSSSTTSVKLPKLYTTIQFAQYRFQLKMKTSKKTAKTPRFVPKVNINAATHARFDNVGRLKKSQTEWTMRERYKAKKAERSKVRNLKPTQTPNQGYSSRQDKHASKSGIRLTETENDVTKSSTSNDNNGNEPAEKLTNKPDQKTALNMNDSSREQQHLQTHKNASSDQSKTAVDSSDVIRQATKLLSSIHIRSQYDTTSNDTSELELDMQRKTGLQPKPRLDGRRTGLQPKQRSDEQEGNDASDGKQKDSSEKLNNRNVRFNKNDKPTESDPIELRSQIKTEAVKAVEEKFNYLEETIVQPIENRFDKLEEKVKRHRKELDKGTKTVLRMLENTMISVKAIEDKFSAIEKRAENVDILEKTLDELETKFTEMKPYELEKKIELVEVKLSRMNTRLEDFKRQVSASTHGSSSSVPNETPSSVEPREAQLDKSNETLTQTDLIRIQQNFHDLKYNIDPDEIIDIMHSAEIISLPQKQKLATMRPPYKKADFILELVRRGTYRYLEVFKAALIKTNQKHLADMLP